MTRATSSTFPVSRHTAAASHIPNDGRLTPASPARPAALRTSPMSLPTAACPLRLVVAHVSTRTSSPSPARTRPSCAAEPAAGANQSRSDSAEHASRVRIWPCGCNRVGMLRLRNVTFMTTDPARLADFWAEALGLPERKSAPDEILLADADWDFPRFTFQRVDDRRSAPSPLHLDLTPDDRLRAVAHLIKLGAKQGATHGDRNFRWTVMQDPDGNEFCVTD